MLQIERTLTEIIPEWVDSACADLVVSDISQDSRNVVPGTLFVARSGANFRGVDFIPQALSQGAVAIVLDNSEIGDCPALDVPVLAVPDLPAQIGLIAARFFGQPSQQLRMIGITGTNGKTSCAHFIAQAMNLLGTKTAVIGTVGNGFPGQLETATHTTPDAIELQRLLAQLQNAGAEAVVMEVSSHALEQGRVSQVAFDYGVFTNLSRDHLDYHGSMAAYGAAKARLFTEFQLKSAVINADDAFGRELLSNETINCAKAAVGRIKGNYLIAAYRLTLKGIEAEMRTPQGMLAFHSRVIGEFNLDNLLLVAALLMEQGYSLVQIQQGLSHLEPVPGRMQALSAERKPLVIIDYAHTPDALEKALTAVRAHTQGQLWCVFGCGGDRDTGKRELMGQVADQLADRLVITSDNPRSEQPGKIIEMVALGVKRQIPEICIDREQAIAEAIRQAGPGDVVLIAGKGHEDYQEVMGKRYPFSDLLMSQKYLEAAA